MIIGAIIIAGAILSASPDWEPCCDYLFALQETGGKDDALDKGRSDDAGKYRRVRVTTLRRDGN